MKRGEVSRVRLPPATGHAQAGTRPSVILQDENYAASAPTVLIVPFTSTFRLTDSLELSMCDPTEQTV